jgi:predicted peptidase
MRGERSRIGAWILAGVAGCAIAASAAPAPAKKAPYAKTVLMIEFAPDRTAMRTAVYEPSAARPAGPRPLILALHYGGPVTPGIGGEYADLLVLPAMKGLGAIVLAPDCPGRGWTDPVSEAAVLALIAEVKKSHAVDDRRVAVTGFSMGAIGAYRLAARHPEMFGAAIPVAGIPDPGDQEGAGRVPLYIIHGEDDEVFPIGKAGPAFEALEKRGPAVRIEIVPGLSHYQTAAYVPALRKAAGWLKRLWRVR